MKRDTCIAFGKRLSFLRREKGLSQEGFADLAGVHRTYMGGIERGERNPTLIMIHKIAAALGLPPAALFSDE